MRKILIVMLIVILGGNTIKAQYKSYNLNDSIVGNNNVGFKSNKKSAPIFRDAIQQRELIINPIFQNTGYAKVNDTIQLDLFSNKKYRACIEKIDVDVNKTLTIRAKLLGCDYSYCIISTFNGKSFISIDVPQSNELFKSNYDHQTNKYYLLQIDKSKQEKLEGAPSLIPPDNIQPKSNLKSNYIQGPKTIELKNGTNKVNVPEIVNSETTPDIITLLIVYTPSAATWATTNETSINNTISLLMAKAQLALDNSNTLLTLQLVHSAQVSYTEHNNSDDLYNLTNTSDGDMDNVHTLRNTYSADVVVLLENISYTGGQGWILSSTFGDPTHAFSLTRVQQASWTYTAIHEIGHNMGCHHHKSQTTQPGPGIFSYSAGWRWTGNNSVRYCDVMTYESGTYYADGLTHTQVEYFSNPSINYQGVATGDATNADNARTIRQTKSVISAYRNPLVSDPTSFSGTGVSQTQINLSWAKNGANNPVLLAVNTSPTFGTPVNGTVYSAGNSISGGGQVIYAGAATTYNHSSLQPGTTYYYKLWSVASGNTFSPGITTNASTPFNTIASFPWNEGFENGNIPTGWTQEQVGGSGINWTFVTGNGGGNPSSAHNGTYNACLKDLSKTDNKTRLITPSFNINSVIGPTLTFWHTQQLWPPDQDELTVYYKTSAGGTWIQLAKYTTSINIWTQETISLPNGSSDYYICFEGNVKYGFGVCIDDVAITIVPYNVALFFLSVGNTVSVCYNAFENITVAGPGYSVELLNGSEATFIAGESINFLEGFHAYEGCQMNAYITTTGDFCSSLPAPAGNTPIVEGINLVSDNNVKTAIPGNTEKMVKVYPNPNNGRFTLELTNFDGLSQVLIINTLGSIIYQTTVNSIEHTELDLAALRKGLYFVRVKNGDVVKTNKMIIQ